MPTIQNKEFNFGFIPPTECLKVQVAIMRVAGEPLLKLAMGKATEEETAKAASGVMIGQMLSKLDAEELQLCMETVFKYCMCDGQRVQIDATFKGQPKLMWQVFIAGLRHNFSDFFQGGLTLSE